MIVKVLACDGAAGVSVLDRAPGVADREVDRLCRWVSSHRRTADATRDRVGEFRLARKAHAPQGDTFTFVVDED